MYPKSIFSLPRKKEDLMSANQGMANLKYEEITSIRNISDTGANTNRFGNGDMTFRFTPESGKHWIPSRSYFEIKYTLSRPNGDQLIMEDNIAPNMGFGSCLFSKQMYKINDKTICEVSEFVAQVDALKTRLSKTGKWMKTTGQTANLWDAHFINRQNKVITAPQLDVSDQNYRSFNVGQLQANTANAIYAGAQNLNVGANNVQLILNGGAILGVETHRFQFGNDANLRFINAPTAATVIINAPNDPLLNLLNFDVGQDVRFYLNGKWHISQVVQIQGRGNAGAGQNAIWVKRVYFNSVGDATAPPAAATLQASTLVGEINLAPVLAQIDRKDSGTQHTLCYQPPLSIFSVPHAIPGSSKHEFLFNAFNDTEYQKRVIESLRADKIHTTNGANNDFRLRIDDMKFYAAMCDGPIVEKDEFFLDLQEIRCQSAKITQANRTQYSFIVSPSTNAFTVAFQDSRVSSSTLYSDTKFKMEKGLEKTLNNFYLRYGGLQKAQPDVRPEWEIGGGGLEKRFQEQYIRSLMYNGSYFDNDSETFSEWIEERGLYLHYPWPKDGSDRSTRAYVSVQFDHIPATAPNLLLFSHFSKVCILKYDNGSLQQVIINEV